jgi:hypothetical protein
MGELISFPSNGAEASGYLAGPSSRRGPVRSAQGASSTLRLTSIPTPNTRFSTTTVDVYAPKAADFGWDRTIDFLHDCLG